MNRSAHIREIARNCGLTVKGVELIALKVFSDSDPCRDLAPVESQAAVALLRGLIARLQAEIRRLSAAGKRRRYPNSYKTKVNQEEPPCCT